MNDLRILTDGCKQLNIEINEQQLGLFGLYLKKLQAYNKKVNITSITDSREIVVKHFLDSLGAFASGCLNSKISLVDIGAGAGFPSIAIKIILPLIKVTLVESSKKKCVFLEHVIEVLGFSDIEIVGLRAEEYGRLAGREHFDVAISRAVSSLATNLEYAIPLLRVGGAYVAMKAHLYNELSTKNACNILTCEKKRVINLEIPFLEAERNLIIFEKKKKTSEKYPRRSGIPTKKPL